LISDLKNDLLAGTDERVELMRATNVVDHPLRKVNWGSQRRAVVRYSRRHGHVMFAFASTIVPPKKPGKSRGRGM
jgi:hypothetical protein